MDAILKAQLTKLRKECDDALNLAGTYARHTHKLEVVVASLEKYIAEAEARDVVVEHSGEPVAVVRRRPNEELAFSPIKDFNVTNGMFLYTHPAPIIDPLAIVKAALEAAAKKCEYIADRFEEEESKIAPDRMTFLAAGAAHCVGHIRALNPQAILDSLEKK